MDASKFKIEIVEDELLVALEVKLQLLNMGYDVTGIASNSMDALSLASETNPDVILMDISIKGDIDGIETAKLAKSKFGIPSVFISAFSEAETKKRIDELSPLGYMPKPIDYNILQGFLLKLLSEPALTHF